MKFKTLKDKERHLNRLYTETFTEDQAVDHFIYLTNKKRQGGSTTENNIRNAYRKRELGTLLRRLDPISFNCE